MDKRCLATEQWLLRYATNRNDLAGGFYKPALVRSASYDRAVGFFRSSTFMVVNREVADFALRSGRIRLISSPELAEADIDSLRRGYELREVVTESVLRVIETALADPRTSTHAEFLATLVANGTIDLRLALRPGALGIFHDKVGLFSDQDGHTLSFTGSLNESLTAWDPQGNHESFDVFRSWVDGDAADRVAAHMAYFQSLWDGREPGVEVMDFPAAARAKLLVVANPAGVEAAYERAAATLKDRPGKLVPLPHQLAALLSWVRNGHRGILTHATASGKTLTAMEAMRIWLLLGRPVLVVVPTDLLFQQWRGELNRQLSDLGPPTLLCGAGNSKWAEGDVLSAFTGKVGGARIVLATLQTASTADFARRLGDGDHLMVVCDEVHRSGAPEYSRILNFQSGARLGLSASAERFGDREGTERIRDYFGPELEPRFGIEDGIRAGRLVPYTYQVHLVELEENEMAAWRTLTADISRAVARSHSQATNDEKLTDHVKMLLIRRARILKQASAKIPFATAFLIDNFRAGDRWLVYCDDQVQLRSLMGRLLEAGLPAGEYHSAMEGDREATLSHFVVTGGILLAIRCLDEGVDIPSADHALILASSRNPREFIQRRGRLLRVAEDKRQAVIHDVLVTPSKDAEPDDLAVLKGEFLRAAEFANAASNDGVKFRLRSLIRDAGFGTAAMSAGFEADTEVEAEDAESS